MIRQIAIVVAVASVTLPRVLQAQVGGNIGAALDCFEVGVEEHRAACTESKSVLYYLRYGDDAEVEQILDGLENMALTARSNMVRISSVAAIGFAGHSDVRGHVGVMPRLVRLYGQSTETVIRHSAITQASLQVDRAAAAAFLADVVVGAPDPRNRGERSLQGSAVGYLSRMGPEGMATLRNLDRDARVRDPAAQRHLETLRERGWTLP